MKKLFVMLALLPLLAFAKPVSFEFAGVSLVDFGQATFKSIMNRDYVISPEVVALDRKISISVKNIEVSEVPRFVENLLLQQGITTTLREGVYYLSAAKSQESIQDRPQPMAQPSPAALPIDAPAGRVWAPAGTLGTFAGEQPGGVRAADDESEMYSPSNRTSEFMASVVVAAFGKRAVVAAGSGLVLTGSKANLAKMRVLLDAIDTLPKLVDVSASWVEVTENIGSSRGISVLANVLGAKFGARLGTLNSGSTISLKNTSFELVIDALNTDSRFKQVSNSRVVGDEYTKLNLIVGDETPTVASSSKDNAGNPVQDIVYRPSGVIVEVLPKVLGGGKINMAIDGQISSFKATATGVSGSPTLIKRQVKTEVTVNDGEVLLIGGLNDAQATDAKSGFAFLPESWSVNSGGKVQTDLVLVLSAKVLK